MFKQIISHPRYKFSSWCIIKPLDVSGGLTEFSVHQDLNAPDYHKHHHDHHDFCYIAHISSLKKCSDSHVNQLERSIWQVREHP